MRDPLPSVDEFKKLEQTSQVSWVQYFGIIRSRQSLDILNDIIQTSDRDQPDQLLLVETFWALTEIGYSGSAVVDQQVATIAASQGWPRHIRCVAAATAAALFEGSGEGDVGQLLFPIVQEWMLPNPEQDGILFLLQTMRRYRAISPQLIPVLDALLNTQNIRPELKREIAYCLSDIPNEKALLMALDIVNSTAFDDLDDRITAHRGAYYGHYHMFVSPPDFIKGRHLTRKKIEYRLTVQYLQDGGARVAPSDVYRGRFRMQPEATRFIKYPVRLPGPIKNDEWDENAYPVVLRGIGFRANEYYQRASVVELLAQGCQAAPLFKSAGSQQAPWAKKGIVYVSPSLGSAVYYSSIFDQKTSFAAFVAIDAAFVNEEYLRLGARLQRESEFQIALNQGVPKSAIRMIVLSVVLRADITAIYKAKETELAALNLVSKVFSETSTPERQAVWRSLRGGMIKKIVWVDLNQVGNDQETIVDGFSAVLDRMNLYEVGQDDFIDHSARFAAARQDARMHYENRLGDKGVFLEVYQLLEKLDDRTFSDEIARIIERLPFPSAVKNKMTRQVSVVQELQTRTLTGADRKYARLYVLLAGLAWDDAVKQVKTYARVLNIPPNLNIEEIMKQGREKADSLDDPNHHVVGKSVSKRLVRIVLSPHLYMGVLQAFQKNRLIVYEQLSQDIVNTPYTDGDRPIRYQDFSMDQIAYRPNHGTLHSMRQVTYVDAIVDAFGLQFSAEEKEILRLAVFLCRSGRTNEWNHFDDPTYGRRSAEIFRLCAEAIGCFSSQLIEKYVRLLSYQPDESPASIMALNVLELAHRIDLFRCWDLNKAGRYLFEHLYKIFPDLPDHSPARANRLAMVWSDLRRLGILANYVTGNRLQCLAGLRVDRQGLDYEISQFINANRPILGEGMVEEYGLSFAYRKKPFVILTHDIPRTQQLLERVRANFWSN